MTRIDTDHTDQKPDVNRVTERVIGCAFLVGKALGPGFLEKVYENALAHELKKAGLRVEQQPRLKVWYDGVCVGEYAADLVVEGSVVVEVKAARALAESHKAQCLHYLAATSLPVCLLLNFAARVEVKRFAGPGAPRLDPSSRPCSSVSSVASSPAFPPVQPGEVPMTWAEAAELEELDSRADPSA